MQLPFETPDPVLPFQADGIRFLVDQMEAGRHPLLADDCGLGKTIQTILACRLLKFTPSVLVLCPPVARENWKREIIRWWPEQAHSVGCPRNSGYLGRWMIDIVGYSHISEWTELRTALLKHHYNVLVLDEVHRLKGKSKRARVVWGNHYNGMGPCLLNNADHVIALSGTPMPNHAGELFNMIRGLWSESLRGTTLMSREVYEDRFCQKYMVQHREQISGSKNLPALKRIMHGHVLRRKKTDVKKDLPPLRFNTEPLSGVLNAEDGKRIKDEAFQALGMVASDSNAAEHLGSNLNGYREKLSTVRRLTGVLKIPLVVDHVAQWLADNPNEKAILFGHHREVCTRLYNDLANFSPVLVNGQTSESEANWGIDRFQKNPDCRLFIGQIEACGEAITLTASSRVFFAESDWTPSKNHQAACRADRIGQTAPVLATFLYLPGSVDELLQAVQMRKTREIQQVFG